MFSKFLLVCVKKSLCGDHKKIYGSELQLNKNKKADALVTHSFVAYEFVAASVKP